MKRGGGGDEDRGAFEAEMRDVKPLAGRGKVVPPLRLPGPGAGPRPLLRAPAIAAETLSTGRAPGVSHDRLRDLRRGQPGPQATLDLHGRTREEALRGLSAFLQGARARGLRCVLIVHGRGLHSGEEGAVLRTAVRGALGSAFSGDVLAFCQAPPHQGGEGASLALLRR